MGYSIATLPELPDLTALLKLSLFSDLEDGDIARLAPLLECGQVSAGECIRQQGDASSRLFIVAEGNIQLKQPGNPEPIEDLYRGDSFGLLSILFPCEACIEAYSAEDSVVIILDGTALRTFGASDPQLYLQILQCILKELTPVVNEALPVISRLCLD